MISYSAIDKMGEPSSQTPSKIHEDKLTLVVENTTPKRLCIKGIIKCLSFLHLLTFIRKDGRDKIFGSSAMGSVVRHPELNNME